MPSRHSLLGRQNRVYFWVKIGRLGGDFPTSATSFQFSRVESAVAVLVLLRAGTSLVKNSSSSEEVLAGETDTAVPKREGKFVKPLRRTWPPGEVLRACNRLKSGPPGRMDRKTNLPTGNGAEHPDDRVTIFLPRHRALTKSSTVGLGRTTSSLHLLRVVCVLSKCERFLPRRRPEMEISGKLSEHLSFSHTENGFVPDAAAPDLRVRK